MFKSRIQLAEEICVCVSTAEFLCARPVNLTSATVSNLESCTFLFAAGSQTLRWT